MEFHAAWGTRAPHAGGRGDVRNLQFPVTTVTPPAAPVYVTKDDMNQKVATLAFKQGCNLDELMQRVKYLEGLVDLLTHHMSLTNPMFASDVNTKGPHGPPAPSAPRFSRSGEHILTNTGWEPVITTPMAMSSLPRNMALVVHKSPPVLMTPKTTSTSMPRFGSLSSRPSSLMSVES